MHARLHAFARLVLDADLEVPGPPPIGDSVAVRGPGRVGRRPRRGDRLVARSRCRVDRRCARRARAPQRRDLRRPPVRARPASELGGARGGARRPVRQRRASATSTWTSTRTNGSQLLAAELRNPRLLRHPDADLGERTRSELAILEAAADAVARVGRRIVPHYVISMAHDVSDVLEVAVLLKEVGLVTSAHGNRPASSQLDIVPLFETIDDLQRCPDVLDAMLHDPVYARHRAIAWQPPGGDGRLFRLEQGRRLPVLAVEPVVCPDGAGRRRSAAPACSSASSTDAAEPSAEAVGPPTRRSWRCPTAPSTERSG